MKDRQQAVEDLSKVLTQGDELVSVIRGHLYVERELARFIEARMPPKALDILDPGYAQMVKLALALGLPDGFETPLRKLGKIRNDFAHELAATISGKDLDAIFLGFSSEMKSVTERVYGQVRGNRLNIEYPESHRDLPPRDKFSLYTTSLWARLRSINDMIE